MIDLSFLTEEEQETILAVLKRDSELKKAEEQRVQNLQKTVSDKGQLRYLTGEWFYETKQLRHQDRIHGSDIVRASMRHTHKPLTILELSQILPEKSSFVSSENKEVFVPPVLCGLLQELSNERYHNQTPYETPEDTPKSVLQSSTKRKNPFNRELNASHTFKEKDSRFLDGAVDQTHKPNEEPLPSSDSSISYAINLRQDPNSLVTQNASCHMPMPGNRAVSTSFQDCFVEVDGPGGRQTNSAAPWDILKHLSTSSSTNSLFSHLYEKNPVSLNFATETWIDKKQVRFSSMVSQSRVKWQDGKKLGEHSLLNIDFNTPSEMENAHLTNRDLENTGSTTSGTNRPLLSQSRMDSVEGELICKNEANLQEQEAGQHQVLGDVSEKCHLELPKSAVSSLISSEQESRKPLHLETEPEEDRHAQARAKDGLTRHKVHQQKLAEQSTVISVEVTSNTKPSTIGISKSSSSAVSPQPRRRLLGIFRREKEKGAELQSPQEKEVNIQQKEPSKTQNLSLDTADMTVDKPASVKHEAKPSEMTEFRTLTALQNTTFKETVITVDADSQQVATEGRVVQFPERLSNMKAFWERENTGDKIIFTRQEARQEDISKMGIEASYGPQTYVESINNLSARREMTFKDAISRSKAKILSPQTECSLFVDLSTEDGTYRANPVLIYEETDHSLTGSVTESEISESQENIITPVPSSVAFSAQQQWGSVPVSLPRRSSSSPEEDRPAKINDLKHFWETEYTGPRTIDARVKEASSSSLLSNKVVSPQSYLRRSLDNRENTEGEAQTSAHKTKSYVFWKSLKVIDKGFVSQSPDRSQLSSSGSTGDSQSRSHQYQVKQRPLSPSKSKMPRSKDQDDEVRRSPSKTYHPRVLPRESSSPKRSRLDGSPLKTFLIDIDPHTKAVEEQQGKLTLVPRQRKSPSHGAKQIVLTDTKPSTDITSCLLPLHPEDRGAYFGNVNTQQSNSSSSTSQQSKKASEKKLRTFTPLARSFIPQDCQHYLGPQERAHVPPFHQEKGVAEESDVVHRPQSALKDSVGNQSTSPTEKNHPRISSWIVEKRDENSSQDTRTRAWSLSWAGSDSYDESSSPIMSALKQLSSRSMSSSKSLENLTSQSSNRNFSSSDTASVFF